MQKHHVNLSAYHFRRANRDGLIEVRNEGSYVMAEYSERTGIVRWQRVLLASQREHIEKWLTEHFPVQPPPQPEPKAIAAPRATARRSSQKKSAKK